MTKIPHPAQRILAIFRDGMQRGADISIEVKIVSAFRPTGVAIDTVGEAILGKLINGRRGRVGTICDGF